MSSEVLLCILFISALLATAAVVVTERDDNTGSDS
jgi:hypothetical protein